ncbi:SRPBCC family protein [Phenylobacterium sp. VNQ135]|uniref:SRPBCC family protein n=1 Tax=Phenylobacterium sp. VNQ135 TaxID=3400922 RepID=UPI003BFCC779
MPDAKSVRTSPSDAGGDAAPQVGVLRHRREAEAWAPAAPGAVFDRLDDQTRLAEHMSRPSLMMGGGRMTYEFDAGRGQAVGSHIRMGGAAFGLSLFVDEVVTLRDPPHLKVWRTTGEPRLLVIGGYEMGFTITEEGAGSRVSVWIDYALPNRGWARWVPALAELYARWCVRRMVTDAVQHFSSIERQSA